MTEPFALHTLPVSNGEIAICRIPLPTDGSLSQLIASAPAMVITMTEADEMARLGALALPQALADAGIDWHHFPIRDFGAPEHETGWPVLSATIHAALSGGGRVVVHCRGGLGRSGMIALRLMIEAGEDPDAALLRLRQTRPGAVETKEQENWARNATVKGTL